MINIFSLSLSLTQNITHNISTGLAFFLPSFTGCHGWIIKTLNYIFFKPWWFSLLFIQAKWDSLPVITRFLLLPLLCLLRLCCSIFSFHFLLNSLTTSSSSSFTYGSNDCSLQWKTRILFSMSFIQELLHLLIFCFR